MGLLLVERPCERLEEHNIIRHPLGYSALGKSKLSQMVKFIRELNPSAQLETCALDVVEQAPEFSKRVSGWQPDLLAVCTDNEPSKHACNAIALALGVPQVGAGVYDGGVGGEVYRVLPGEACYGCLATHLQLKRQMLDPRPNVDYNSLPPDEAPSTTALNLDIEQLAILQSRWVIDTLLQDSSPDVCTGLPAQVNLWVFANRVVPGIFRRPLHAEFFSIPKDADCFNCGTAKAGLDQKANEILNRLQASSATQVAS
jgi:hypothetical protein